MEKVDVVHVIHLHEDFVVGHICLIFLIFSKTSGLIFHDVS